MASETVYWRSHVRNMFDEILVNQEMRIFEQPLRITMSILGEIAEIAADSGDEIMIAQCCRLALYTFADPTHEDYDEKRTAGYLAKLDEYAINRFR